MDNMKYTARLVERYPELFVCKADIEKAVLMMIRSFEEGGKLLVAGNGGSCADADHITGELLKGFCKKRKADDAFINRIKEVDPESGEYLSGRLQGSLPAISLANNSALMTAGLNDIDGGVIFAQQVNGYGKKGDVFLGISTSGNSKNIVYAMALAKAKGLDTIALTGNAGGKLKKIADVCICAPASETFVIQELHLPVYHALCLEIEEHFWSE